VALLENMARCQPAHRFHGRAVLAQKAVNRALEKVMMNDMRSAALWRLPNEGGR